jgi:spore maturation protein A
MGMLAFGIIVGVINGRMDEVTRAVMESAQGAVELGIGLMGVMCLWTGLMNIAEKSGMVQWIAKVVRPVLSFLFPDVPKKHPAIGAIVMNFVANFLGLGNAATPLGLKAMAELQKLNPKKETATHAMSMFLVANTAALQLVPATIIALRVNAGAEKPTEIMVPIWIATVCASIAGITAVKLFSSGRKGRRKP